MSRDVPTGIKSLGHKLARVVTHHDASGKQICMNYDFALTSQEVFQYKIILDRINFLHTIRYSCLTDFVRCSYQTYPYCVSLLGNCHSAKIMGHVIKACIHCLLPASSIWSNSLRISKPLASSGCCFYSQDWPGLSLLVSAFRILPCWNLFLKDFHKHWPSASSSVGVFCPYCCQSACI